MIERYTNKSANVSVEATYVALNDSTPNYGAEYLNAGSNTLALIKFSGLDLSKFDKIGKAVLRLIVSQDATIIQDPILKSEIYIQRNIEDFNPETVIWTNRPATSNINDAAVLVPKAYTVVGDMTPHFTMIEIDLSSIFSYWKKYGITTHGITILKPSGIMSILGFDAYEDKGIKDYFIIEDSKLDGLAPHLSHTPVDCGFAGKVFINDLTGKTVHQISGFQTESNLVPITFTAFQSGKSLDGFGKTNLMGSKYRANFEYAFKVETDRAKLIHPNGAESIFMKMTKDEAADYDIITQSEIVYVDLSTYAYATTSGTIITVKNQDKSVMVFDLNKMISFTSKDNDVINYHWLNNKLDYIDNDEGQRVNYSYDVNGRIVDVEFVEEKRLLEFTYDALDNITSIKLNKWIIDPLSSQGARIYTELESASFQKTTSLFQTVDEKTNDRVEFVLSSESVTKVYVKKHATNTIVSELSFTRVNDRTIIEDYLGKKQYLSFDSYGQLTHRLDEFGNSHKVEYNLVGKDGTSRKVSSKSDIQSNKGNLINDPSFDAQVGEYHTDTQGWKKNTNTNNIVKSFDDGVFGNQCLMVRKFGSGATSIYQEIPVSPGVYKFIGYEKRRGISGNPTVRAVATYTIQRLAQGSEEGELDNSGNAWVSDTVTTTSTTGSLSGTTHEWQKFELSVTIPTGATSCSIKLEVYATHTTGDLFVDDFQLSQSEQAVNYNLIPNGYFEKDTSTTPTGWQHENLSVQDVLIISNPEEPYASFIGNRKMRFTSDFTKTKKLYKAFDIYGSAGDEFLISGWFEGKVTGNEEAFMKAVVSYDTKPAETFIFSLNPNDDGWQNVTRGFVAKDAYHGIEISIEHRGIYELCFDALQLYLNSSSNIYQYDDMGNMMDYMKSQSSNESIRNASGEVLISTNDQGETHRYTYDDKKQLTLVKDNKGNRVRNTYDSKGNQTKMELESSLGKMTHNMTFNTKNQLTKIIDEFGFETNYIYDDENRSSEVINPLGHKDKSEYNEFDQLIKIIKESASGTNESLSYVYDDARNLKKIIVDANTRYEFFYDVYNQLIEVKLNNYTIVKYEYNLKQQMIKQTYGSSGDYYEFAYDEKDRLKTIKLNGLMSSLCTYTYDDFNRIAKANYKGVTTNYSYDRSGKLIRKTDSQGQSERFIYDNIDTIQKSTIDINGIVRSFEYIMPYETSQDNFDGFLNRLDKAYSDERITTIAGEKAQTGMTPFFKYNYTIEESLDFPYSFIQFGNPGAQANYNLNHANTRRSYHLADHSKFDYAQWKAKFDKKKTAYGWFNVNANRTYRQRLLTFGTYQYSKWMTLSLETNNTLRITSGAQVIDIPSSVFSYTHKPWSFISWQIETINQSIKLRVFIDGVSIPEQTINLVDGTTPVLVSDMTQLGVGYSVTRGYEEDCPVDPFKVMYLAVGAYDYSEEEISKIYNLSLPYFEQAQIRKQRSGVLYHDHEAYDGFDVTTLKGTLVSEKGIQPESYGYQAASYKLDKSKLFEYDDLRKIHVYGSYEDNVKDLGTNKAKLVYDFNLKNEGTISLRFKPKMLTSDLRTILSLQKDTETPLGLYVNSDNQLCLTLGQFESLSVPVNHDAWNHLVISWSGTSLWIYLNNNQMIPKTKSVSFDQCKLSIGSLINNLEPTYHFNGQFEMLAYSDQVVDTTKVSQLRNSFQTVSVESVYDYLGRKEKEEIKVGTQVLESSMTYKSPGIGKTSMQVENFETYTGENITYVYDDLGNVIHMDTADGIYDYEYDYMGRLISEYNPVLDQTIKIEYNKQNIAYKRYYVGKTTTIDKEMEFLTNSENQLLFVDTIKDANVVSLPLTYPSSYLGNPTMIGSKTLSWEGRKLIAIPSDNVSYTYNEQGIRTKKIVNGVETKYNLKGSNIIAETKDSVTTFFIYNEQDELVGFEYNNNHYFYVRDLLGKITEVIDKNGTVMVSYKYDAWGKWINKDTASNGTTLGDTLVTVNPFIYKGYYYDSETDWYYLKSRYYCPVLSRFINSDIVQNLQPDTTSAVNLFTYTNNNPIMYVDFNGNKPKWWQWVASTAAVIAGVALVATGVGGVAGGMLISAGISSIVGGYINEANGGSFDSGYFIGAATGALAGLTAGWGGTLMVSATAPGVTSTAVIGYISSALAVSFGGGFLASYGNVLLNSYFNGTEFDYDQALEAGLLGGTFNIISAYLAGTSQIISSTGKTIVDNQRYVYYALSGYIGFAGEALVQSTVYGLNKLNEWFDKNKDKIKKYIPYIV